MNCHYSLPTTFGEGKPWGRALPSRFDLRREPGGLPDQFRMRGSTARALPYPGVGARRAVPLLPMRRQKEAYPISGRQAGNRLGDMILRHIEIRQGKPLAE